MFGSAFLGAHMMRGAAAAALLAWAIVYQTAQSLAILGRGRCRPRRATRMPDVLDCRLGRDAFAGPSRSTIRYDEAAIATASLSRVHAGICEAGATS
jgi:hypothetical protein